MSKSLEFTNVILKTISRTSKGGTAAFSASLTKPVIAAMKWGDVPDWQTGSKPEGDLHAQSMTLTPPPGTALKNNVVTVEISRVCEFEMVRREIEGKKGKGHRVDLHFKAKFADPTGLAFLEEYMVNVGEEKGRMNIEYNPAAEQQSLIPEDVKASDEQKQAALEI